MIPRAFPLCLAVIASIAADARGEIAVTTGRNRGPAATRSFAFESVPSPAAGDAAAGATISVAGGKLDSNSAPLHALVDGELPSGEDQPGANLFFAPNSWGGRIVMDLGNAVPIRQINTYSWHPGDRGPQLYKVYGSSGRARRFDPAPKSTIDPTARGWTLLAFVDTRASDGDEGGQYGVSISGTEGTLGTWRYLLFDVFETESDDAWGQTFYSEIDVVR